MMHALAALGIVGWPAAAASAAGWSERDISIDGGKAPLHGTLTLPDGAARVDAVLILAGSGPTDRDGNAPALGLRTDCLRLLAHGLAAAGFAALRIDKRGVGASAEAAPAEADLRFDMYVADAVRWIDRLRAEPRIGRVFVAGHSEGALVATLAARRTPVAGLVLIAGAGVAADAILRRQFAAAPVAPALRDAARRIIDALAKGEAVADPPPALAAAFRPSAQPYVISWMRYEPAAELAKITTRALVVQGTTDLQTTVDDARRLAGSRAGVRLAIIDGMNHVLKVAPAERTANLATYADPQRPLAPTLLATIADFLRE